MAFRTSRKNVDPWGLNVDPEDDVPDHPLEFGFHVEEEIEFELPEDEPDFFEPKLLLRRAA